jgi:hypothetical protein
MDAAGEESPEVSASGEGRGERTESKTSKGNELPIKSKALPGYRVLALAKRDAAGIFPARLEQVKTALELAAIGPDVGMNLAILNDTGPIPLKENLNGFTFIRSQIPVKPVFAGTVPRSQGMTLSKAIIDCRTSFWEHGQRCATLSRVRSPENICVLLPADLTDFSVNPLVDQKVAEILEAIDNGMDRHFLSDIEDLGAEMSPPPERLYRPRHEDVDPDLGKEDDIMAEDVLSDGLDSNELDVDQEENACRLLVPDVSDTGGVDDPVTEQCPDALPSGQEPVQQGTIVEVVPLGRIILNMLALANAKFNQGYWCPRGRSKRITFLNSRIHHPVVKIRSCSEISGGSFCPRSTCTRV